MPQGHERTVYREASRLDNNRRAVRYGIARRIRDLKSLIEVSADADEQAQARRIIEDLDEIYEALG